MENPILLSSALLALALGIHRWELCRQLVLLWHSGPQPMKSHQPCLHMFHCFVFFLKGIVFMMFVEKFLEANKWNKLSPTGTVPSGRISHSMVWSSERRIYIFGGLDGAILKEKLILFDFTKNSVLTFLNLVLFAYWCLAASFVLSVSEGSARNDLHYYDSQAWLALDCGRQLSFVHMTLRVAFCALARPTHGTHFLQVEHHRHDMDIQPYGVW